MPAVMEVHIAYSTWQPIEWTVLTDVCTINGDRASTAASEHCFRG